MPISTFLRVHVCLFVCFIEFKGFPRQDLRSPDRGDLRNGFVVCDCELDKD